MTSEGMREEGEDEEDEEEEEDCSAASFEHMRQIISNAREDGG
jgi:hypothetical protein